MHFLIYTKYRFTNLLKTKAFWICLILYYVLLSAFLYVVPIVLNISYLELFTYRSILIMINLVLIMAVVYSVILLFKQGYEDGSELILHSKPLTKAIVVWGKIFIIFLTGILISAIQIVETSFIALIETDKNVLNGILLGSFLGPFITCLFWSGISIICCFLFKKGTILLFILGINGVLSIVNLITGLLGTKPITKIQKMKMDFASVNLINQNTKETTKTYAIATTNGLPINSETKIDGKTLSQLGYTTKNLLQNSWNTAVKESTNFINSYLDGSAYLNSFYYVNLNKFSNYEFRYNLKELLEYDFVYYFTFKPENLVLNNVEKIKLKETELYLSNINSYTDINSFTTNNQNIELPYSNFDSSTNNYSKKYFEDDLDFINTYFNNNEITRAKDFQKFLKSAINKKWGENIGNYYFSIFSSYVATLNKININNYKNNDKFNHDLNEILITFQYKVFQLLKKYYNNELPNVSEEVVKIWFSILNQNNINDPNTDINFSTNSTGQILILSALEYYNLMTNLQQKNPNDLSGFVVEKELYLKLLTNKHLETLSEITIESVYLYTATIPITIIASILTIIGSTSIMLRKDAI